MTTPDVLPVWVWVPLAVFLWSWTIRAILSAPSDPDPHYSRLDCMDGLDSRTADPR